jgi:hypothetical protein
MLMGCCMFSWRDVVFCSKLTRPSGCPVLSSLGCNWLHDQLA